MSRRQVKSMYYSEVEPMTNSELIGDSESVCSQGRNIAATTSIHGAIVISLILAVFQDIQTHKVARIDKQELGWRNKYNIHLMSGVSQKKIYKECGILEELIEQGVVERRLSLSRWGQQKHQYRLSFSALFESPDSLQVDFRPKQYNTHRKQVDVR